MRTAMQVDAASVVSSLAGRSTLRALRVVGYTFPNAAAALEEFAALPALEELILSIEEPIGRSAVAPPPLACMSRLHHHLGCALTRSLMLTCHA